MEFLPLGTGRRDMLILGKEKHFPKRDKQLLCRLTQPSRAGSGQASHARDRRDARAEKALNGRGCSALSLPPSLALKGFGRRPFAALLLSIPKTNKALLLREKSPS
jgi:hypothetical protein